MMLKLRVKFLMTCRYGTRRLQAEYLVGHSAASYEQKSNVS